jgi:hypothetical protein
MQKNFDFIFQADGVIVAHYNNIVSAVERFGFCRATFVYGGNAMDGTTFALICTNKKPEADEAGLNEWFLKTVPGKRVSSVSGKKQ